MADTNDGTLELSGSEGEFVTLEYAANLTANYRQQSDAHSRFSHVFGVEKLMAIINQAECVGVRVYYGLDDEGNQELVLIGTDAAGNDIFTGPMVNRGIFCPPHCSDPNGLNSTQ